MPLFETHMLLDRFVQLLGDSTRVDIAVAWAGPGLAVESLVEHAPHTRIRIAVGLSGNATEPATLRRLMAMECVELRVASAPTGGIFHPKFYRFRTHERAVCWIGSANLTRGGFGGNAELVHEFTDIEGVGASWFEGLWDGLDEDPEPAIADYEERYRPPRPGGYRGGRRPRRIDLPSLDDVNSWDEFVSGLRTLDAYCHRCEFAWDVLGETFSYLHTIGVGREIARRGHWEDFSRRDRNILLGLGHWDRTGAWGLLGNMRNAGRVVSAFTPPGSPEARAHVLEQIHSVVDAGQGNVVQAAESAIAEISRLRGFGPGVSTRVLALARPDRLVSVNEPSSAGLGDFAGMDSDPDRLARNYGDLLGEFLHRDWFVAQEPQDTREREIWRCRAALVDAYVYIPNREMDADE